jgi:hypothetical protein
MESCVYMLSQRPECKLQSKHKNTTTKKEDKKYKTKQKELQLIKRKVGENNRRKILIKKSEHYNP